MAISLAYPAWVLSHLTASSFNTTSDPNPALGIRLDLSVNSTSLRVGNSISIAISEHNIRYFQNDVRAASGWKVGGLSLGPCGTLNFPMGFAVMKGNYTKENISTGHPLQLYPSGMYSCPMILSGIDSYILDPLSDAANVMGTCTPNPCFRLSMENRNEVAGSWDNTILAPIGVSNYHLFSPGVYTVVGGDEWGDLAVLNFTVF